MGILAQARNEFARLLEEKGTDRRLRLTVHPLSADEAVGAKADDALAIKKGKERVIEAVFMGAHGQAFTDRPSRWDGTLHEALSLDLSSTEHRAVFVAVMNAVLRSLGMASGTVHCQEDEPSRCGLEIVEAMESRFGRKRYGLIGLQPAILKALVNRFGAESVRVLDLDPDNIGTRKCGVDVWNGETDLPRLVEWCDMGLATGSSIVNATIDEIKERFDEAGKPLVLFGNTISGVAALLDLDRLCPFGR